MEPWVIYALLGMITAGFFSFSQKIAAERKYSSLEFGFSVLLGQTVISFLAWWYYKFPTIDLSTVLLLIIAIGLLAFFVNILRVQALNHIDTAIFFPIYKAIGPTLVTFAGLYIFHEQLSFLEIVGILLGIVVPLLLLHKSENGRQKNLKTGLILLVISVLATSVLAALQKIIADTDVDLFLTILIASAVATIAGFIYIFIFKHHRKTSVMPTISMYKFGMMTGFINVFGVFFILKSFEGSLAIAYTINSFYILIPIVLSVLIYKEHMNVRKSVAIGLSILAILLFQI